MSLHCQSCLECVSIDYARFMFILFCKSRANASVHGARETYTEREMCRYLYDLWKNNYHVIIYTS